MSNKILKLQLLTMADNSLGLCGNVSTRPPDTSAQIPAMGSIEQRLTAVPW